MYLIKNRVTNEYDTKGIYGKFHLINRYAWKELTHAKNHVIYKLGVESKSDDNEKNLKFDWYMNADFIELSENGGVISKIPVSTYLHEYFKRSRWVDRLSVEQKNRLGLDGVFK